MKKLSLAQRILLSLVKKGEEGVTYKEFKNYPSFRTRMSDIKHKAALYRITLVSKRDGNRSTHRYQLKGAKTNIKKLMIEFGLSGEV